MSAQDPSDRLDNPGATPTLADLLALFRRSIELEIRVCMPGHVLAYDPTTQRAQVALGLLPVALVEGEEVPQAQIVIPSARVQWPGGSLGYVTTPLVPGDTGKVSFTDRCLTHWLLTGTPTDPINGRTHALADAIFEPGVRADPDVITPPTDLTATVVEGPLVKLGRLATLGVAMDAGGAQIALDAAVTALTTIVGTPVPEPPASGAGAAIDAMAAALLAVVQALQVSTKVLAEPTP